MIAKKIDRLHKLHQCDLGFYMLGLHSFIEGYIYSITGVDEKNFYQNLATYNCYLRAKNKEGYHNRFLRDLVKDHNNTNRVRHQFEDVYSSEAESATHRFIKFLRKTELESDDYDSLESLYKQWNSRTNLNAEDSKALQNSLNKAKEDILSLQSELSEYRGIRTELELLQSEKTLLESKISSGLGDRERLESEKLVLQDRLEELEASSKEVKAMENYIHYLSRFSLYTRTRAEYEKSVLRLSRDQVSALERISLQKDFLIKGAAGTGKSLVLIKAIEKVMELNSLGDDFFHGRVLLLSFSKTLKKYNEYMANLLNAGLDEGAISTVYSFIYSKFRVLFPEYSLDMDFCPILPSEGYKRFSKKDLKDEIENFILSGNVTRDEYCTKGGIKRSGMKIRHLNLEDREVVWSIFQDYITFMEEKKVVNIPYLRYKVLNYLIDHPDDSEIRDVFYMFVDEVQDMTPASLSILKELTRGVVVMAGDDNQKIFAASSPYKRAGINIQGSTVVLRENFRNTNQIMNFANSILGKRVEKIEQFESFRDGPEPEVYRCKSRSKALIDKLKIYHEDLGYELHNIAVIIPSLKGGGTSLIKKIEKIGYKTSFIDENFDFESENSVRITTLQNCKGLDFPVVLLYLPFVFKNTTYTEQTADEMARNLLYVACTRAMDNLDVFIDEKPKGILEEFV